MNGSRDPDDYGVNTQTDTRQVYTKTNQGSSKQNTAVIPSTRPIRIKKERSVLPSAACEVVFPGSVLEDVTGFHVKRVNGVSSSGYPGVSWNKRMKAWLAFYYDGATRRSRTFSPKSMGVNIEDARLAAIEFMKSVECKKRKAGIPDLKGSKRAFPQESSPRRRSSDSANILSPQSPDGYSNFSADIDNYANYANLTISAKKLCYEAAPLESLCSTVTSRTSGISGHETEHLPLPSTMAGSDQQSAETTDLQSVVEQMIRGNDGTIEDQSHAFASRSRRPSLWMQSAAGDLDATNLCYSRGQSRRESSLLQLCRANAAESPTALTPQQSAEYTRFGSGVGNPLFGRLDSVDPATLCSDGKLAAEPSKEDSYLVRTDTLSDTAPFGLNYSGRRVGEPRPQSYSFTGGLSKDWARGSPFSEGLLSAVTGGHLVRSINVRDSSAISLQDALECEAKGSSVSGEAAPDV